MKIEKKKVIGNSRLSKATKAGVASLLGMSAILMSGCLDDAESSPVAGPIEPDNNTPKSPEVESSSSVADIPLSHERLSSEAIEALSSSSVQSPSSSSENLASSSSENLASSSSETPSSSSEEAVSSSSESSSSTFVEHVRSSSSVKEESRSSSSDTVVPPYPRMCETVDSTGIHVIMCHDDDRGMIASMVSTYEMLDLS